MTWSMNSSQPKMELGHLIGLDIPRYISAYVMWLQRKSSFPRESSKRVESIRIDHA